jgi:truncated hemoglobin YjbI
LRSLYEHAGGEQALHRVEELFYSKVLADPILSTLFTERRPHHVDHLTWFTAESLGGPDRFTREVGFRHIYPTMNPFERRCAPILNLVHESHSRTPGPRPRPTCIRFGRFLGGTGPRKNDSCANPPQRANVSTHDAMSEKGEDFRHSARGTPLGDRRTDGAWPTSGPSSLNPRRYRSLNAS